MLGLRRRRAGVQHRLGAAVTGIPSAPRRPDVPAAAEVPPTAPTALPFEGRVELGFRDGTSAALEPGSEQARALQELAGRLCPDQGPVRVKPRRVPADTD